MEPSKIGQDRDMSVKNSNRMRAKTICDRRYLRELAQTGACGRMRRSCTAGNRLSGWLVIGCCLWLLSGACLQLASAQTTSADVSSDTDATEETSGATQPPTTTTPAPTPAPPPQQEETKSRTPAPINYTQVLERFEETRPEAEVVEKWRHMDKQMSTGIAGLLKIIFPQVVAMSTDAKVSGNCSGAILKWILNLRNTRTWAFKMLDASGKPGAGILEGSLTMFGNYRQCLDIRAPDEDEIELVEEFREYFRGQYCVLRLKPHLPARHTFYSLNSTYPALLRKNYKYYEKNIYDDLAELAMAFHFVSVRADFCVPSLCSRDDIQRVANFLVSKLDMRAYVERCEIDPIEGQPQLASHEQATTSASHSTNNGYLAWALVCLILLALVLFSTLANLTLKLRECSSKSRAHSLLASMSLHKSLAQMRAVHLDRINDSKPAFLYTLRLVVVLWFCACELTRQLNFQFLRQLLQLRSIIMLWPMQILVNGTLQFDSLIFLTAFTYAYQNINSNLKDLIKYNVAKYSRLMPCIMVLVALTILAPILLVNLSPVWTDFMAGQSEVCQRTGFINLFFLQNLLDYKQICLPHTWLFCVELQLSLLAIPIVYWMNRNFDSKQGRFSLLSWPTATLVLATLAGCLMNFQNIHSQQLPGAWFETFPDPRDRAAFMSRHLLKTWVHLPVFALGLLAGHLCRCQSVCCFSGRPYGRKSCDNLIWMTSILLMALSTFSTHAWSLSGRSHLDEPLMSAAYAALAPLAWAIASALLLFYLTVPDSQGQQPVLGRLLTLDSNLIRLGRLSFLIYLIIPFVHRLVYALQEQTIFSSLIMLSHTLVGNLTLTLVLAIFMSALVELPCRRLIKKLALGSKRHCTNLGVIARQLHLRQEAQGPNRDSFEARQQQQHQQQLQIQIQHQAHQMQHLQPQRSKQ